MVAKGATIREMTQLLADRGEANPETSQPWNHATIGRDVIALREMWKLEASQTILDHKARLLAEINAVKRDAWKASDLRIILESIKSERQLLGLDAPVKVHTEIRATKEAESITDEERSSRIMEILSAAEIRREMEIHPLYPPRP
jgi:hypothetical protein